MAKTVAKKKPAAAKPKTAAKKPTKPAAEAVAVKAKKKVAKPVTAKAPASAAKAPVAASTSMTLADFYRSTLTSIDDGLGISTSYNKKATPVTTGSLVIDRIIGGGVTPGMYMTAGEEACGKSTITLCVIAAAIRAGVPLVSFVDAEGALDPQYAQATLGREFDVPSLIRDGRLNYVPSTFMEDFMVRMKRLVNRMPDKVWIPSAKTWAYAVDKGGAKQDVVIIKALEKAGLKLDKKLSTQEKRWIYPTTYAGAEAVIALDSIAALNPRSAMDDEKDDKGAGMSAVARVLGERLPKFAGRLRQKGIVLWTIHQLREKPGVMYGSPYYVTGGNALKHYTTCRNWMFPRAVPKGYIRDKKAGGVCIEPSVTKAGGTDRYVFKFTDNVKNKMGTPFIKGMLRIWIADADGEPRGIDPVYDTETYLRDTGQLSGPPKKMAFKILPSAPALAKALNGKVLDYTTFKSIIVAEHFKDKALLAKALKAAGLKEAPKVRARLTAQVQTDRTVCQAMAPAEVVEDDFEDAETLDE